MATNGRREVGFMTQERHTQMPGCHTVAQEQISLVLRAGKNQSLSLVT